MKNSCEKVLFLLLFTRVSSEYCTSQICEEASTYVANTVDANVDPCDNFYKFACGGLFRKTLKGKRVSLIAILENEVDSQIKAMLQETPQNMEPKAIQALKKFFNSCMDENSIEENGVATINSVLNEIGGWPVLSGLKWKGNNFKIENLISKLRKLGYEHSQLFYFSVSEHEPNKISIGPPIASLLQHKNKRQYHHFATNIAVLLGADSRIALEELLQVLWFESKLYKVANEPSKPRKTSFGSIQERYPFVNWLKLINNVYPYDRFTEVDRGYFPLKYLKNLNGLLKGTSNRTIANYIIWKAIEGVIPYLPKAFRERKIYYDSYVSPAFAEQEQDRFIVCKWASILILPPTLETLYFKKYFPIERKATIKKFVSFIKREFVKLLMTSDLYDEMSRNRALTKASLITSLVGGPHELFHEERLAEMFDEDENTNSDECLMLASLLNRQRSNYRLRFNVTLNDAYSMYIAVNAYYSNLAKSLVIPAAVMQGLFFNEKRPHYMNFGTLGMLVGHELTHAFGQNANKEDNAWTYVTTKRFLKRAEYIVRQIRSFKIEGSDLHMNGTKTLEETICDFNGARIAYQSYQSWISIHGEENQLPDLNYTTSQLFWISAANFFCDIVPPNKIQELLNKDPHSHPEFRVLGSLSNNDDFARDFGCPVGSKMNPSEKCRIF